MDRLFLFRLECPYDEIHLTFCGDEGVDAIEYPNEAALSSIVVPGDIIFSPENIRSIETQMNSLIRKGYSDALQALVCYLFHFSNKNLREKVFIFRLGVDNIFSCWMLLLLIDSYLFIYISRSRSRSS